MFSLGREPQGKDDKKKEAPEGRQIIGCGVSRSPPPRTSVAAPRLMVFSGLESWGSRPRLSIFRRSAARGTCLSKWLLGFTSSVSPGETRMRC